MSFARSLADAGLSITRVKPEILQLNVGKLCNLTCVHCHVNAGPARKEIVTGETIDKILEWYEQTDIPTLDLTGGTPEMIPDFRRLVETVRGFDRPRRVMTRLNATIINEPGYEWVPEFHAKHKVAVIASMPCYAPDNVNAQRGEGVFDSSIEAFQKLNALGYGTDPELELNFVYNPNGAFLPPDQAELEADYKEEMRKHFGIEFNHLYAIANIIIGRYGSYLRRNNQLDEYQQLLREAFNPSTIAGLMCRDTINVSWKGDVYDCDFNQMLKMDVAMGNAEDAATSGTKVWDLEIDEFLKAPVRVADHCYACTAGSGSSCGGALLDA